MDHLRSTKNFTLQHLRFLVIDEADRLLSQNFNDWLKVLIAHIESKEGLQDALDTSTGSIDEGEEKDVDMPLETDALAPQLVDCCFPLLEESISSSILTSSVSGYILHPSVQHTSMLSLWTICRPRNSCSQLL